MPQPALSQEAPEKAPHKAEREPGVTNPTITRTKKSDNLRKLFGIDKINYPSPRVSQDDDDSFLYMRNITNQAR